MDFYLLYFGCLSINFCGQFWLDFYVNTDCGRKNPLLLILCEFPNENLLHDILLVKIRLAFLTTDWVLFCGLWSRRLIQFCFCDGFFTGIHA